MPGTHEGELEVVRLDIVTEGRAGTTAWCGLQVFLLVGPGSYNAANESERANPTGLAVG